MDSQSNSLKIWFKAYTDAVEMIRYTLATNHVYLGDILLLRVLKKYLFRCFDKNCPFLITLSRSVKAIKLALARSIIYPGDVPLVS